MANVPENNKWKPDQIETESKNKTVLHKGLRYNEGKPRYDLLPAHAINELVKVLTAGAKKYADRNWEQGMKWSNVIASLKRHLAKFEMGEDYDEETGMLHCAQIMWNAMALTEYYKTYPQGDDRPHNYLNRAKIGLDIDEVMCDWVGPWCERFGYEYPNNWDFSYGNHDNFKSFEKEEMNEFYLDLPAKIDPKDIPFEPHCYITSRSVPVELTMQWIEKNHFPTVPIYSVGFGQSKIEVAHCSGIDWFIDDRYENFVELNNAGICTFLLDAPWNRRYNVGYKRIMNFEDFKQRFL